MSTALYRATAYKFMLVCRFLLSHKTRAIYLMSELYSRDREASSWVETEGGGGGISKGASIVLTCTTTTKTPVATSVASNDRNKTSHKNVVYLSTVSITKWHLQHLFISTKQCCLLMSEQHTIWWVSQLPAQNTGISIIPEVITHSCPHRSNAYFHTSSKCTAWAN